MEKVIGILKGFKDYPWYGKALVVLGLPVLLLLLVFAATGTLLSFFNERKRDQTDADAAKIDQKIQADQNQIAEQQGRIDQLEEDKKEAVENAKEQDAVSFYNNRFGKPDNK